MPGRQTSILIHLHYHSLAMLGSYVCRQCRARLNSRRVPATIPQWQSRATFISLRNTQPQPNAEQTEAPTQADDASIVPENQQTSSYNLFGRSQASSQLPSNGLRRGRYSRHASRNDDAAPEVCNAALPAATKSAEDEGPFYASKIVRRLRGQGIEEAWRLFERTYTSADCEALTNPSAADIRQINEMHFFSYFMKQIIKGFCEGPGEPTVSPTTALFKYEQLGIASPGLWVRDAIEPLTQQVMLAANGAGPNPQRDLPSLLFELISVWRLFFQCKGQGNDSLETISPEWNLPAVDAMPQMFQSVDFNMRLQDFHPKSMGSPTLGFSAIYLFNLSDAINADDSLRLQAAPFLDLLVRVLSGARVNAVLKYPAYSFRFKELPTDIQVEITKEIDTAPLRALSILGRQQWSESDKKSKMSAGQSATQATTDLESFNLKAIARAVESRTSPVVLENHWKRIVRDYTQNGKTLIPPSIYNAFLSGYLVLRQAPRSVEVWNHMISNGVKPELPTWVAMLEGCEKAKDLEGFNAMWQRMQSTGIEPDNYAWTTRIHGLMSFRQIDLGLRALDDMGKRWRSAETTKNAPSSNSRSSKGAKNLPTSAKLINNYTKPSIEVINGAISGIVQVPQMHNQKRVEYVQKILRWGTQFDVKPNTRTFNILIQLYLNAGDHATAFKVLKQMEHNGCPADISTHTMLITATFGNGTLDNLSEADRANRLIQMLEELEAGGMRLNNYVYATVIDRLLKQYSSHDAVRTIIEHMRSRNLSPSAHVYTSLVTYYFQQEPPAITAVDSLLQQIFESRHADTDKVLFDRSIEGYAAHGEVGKMMSVLTRMSKSGKHPGFQALTAVIKALVAAGDADRARWVVRDVQRGEGVAHGGVTGAFNEQKHFLDVAQSLGIGSDEERMGDMFKMRKDMKALDEQIEARLQEEQKVVEKQPELEIPRQTIGASGDVSIVQKASEPGSQSQGKSSPARQASEQPSSEPRELGPAEDEIHGFLHGSADAEARQR